MSNLAGRLIDDVWADGYEKAVVELLEALRQDILLLDDTPRLAAYIALTRTWKDAEEWGELMTRGVKE